MFSLIHTHSQGCERNSLQRTIDGTAETQQRCEVFLKDERDANLRCVTPEIVPDGNGVLWHPTMPCVSLSFCVNSHGAKLSQLIMF